MPTTKKGDSVWIVIVGIIFILLVSVLLLVPKSYFNMERFIDPPIGTSTMTSYLTKDVSTADFEDKFNKAFVNPDTMALTYTNGNDLLIPRRCYQFTDFGCKYETDKTKREKCEKVRQDIITNSNMISLGLDKIDYSITSVMAFFDNIAAGQSIFNILCKTFRLYTDNAGEINDTVTNEILNQYRILQKPLEGGVHVLIVQAPFHRNFTGEFLSVNYTTTTTQPYFDNYDVTTKSKRSTPVSDGKIITYIVVMYGLYQKDGNTMNPYDLFDGVGGKTEGTLMNILDKLYASKEDTCKLNCPNRSDMYCGCGSTPVVPGFIADKSKGDRGYTDMLLGIPSDQREVSDNDRKSFVSNYSMLYNNPNKNNIFFNFRNTNDVSTNYQSKCIGPNIPLALQSGIVNKNELNATTLATYAILYKVNPKAIMNKSIFKVMNDKYPDLPSIKGS